ncbi:MAG: hypothetical protein AB7N24_00910 [Dehalococcoidia bacterium]
MQVALVSNYRAHKREPLADLLERIHGAFAAAGEGEPEMTFTFADGPLPGAVSSIDRVLKRFPAFAASVTNEPGVPGGPAVRMLSNRGVVGDPVNFATILEIAKGVPRSFPFHAVSLHLRSAGFGETVGAPGPAGAMTPGVLIGDSWWVNGRTRSLMSVVITEVAVAGKALPELPAGVAAILAECGKPQSTSQLPLGVPPFAQAAQVAAPGAPDRAAAQAVATVLRDFRSRMAEILGAAALPHELPPLAEALRTRSRQVSGPKKPALEAAFKPMGYRIKGGSGTFTLRRRTSANHTIEISMDVGTWSNSFTGSYAVHGLGFTALLPLPVAATALGAPQYPIGDDAGWRQVVDNLAALVTELDRTFVPAVERAAGPSPDWFDP